MHQKNSNIKTGLMWVLFVLMLVIIVMGVYIIRTQNNLKKYAPFPIAESITIPTDDLMVPTVAPEVPITPEQPLAASLPGHAESIKFGSVDWANIDVSEMAPRANQAGEIFTGSVSLDEVGDYNQDNHTDGLFSGMGSNNTVSVIAFWDPNVGDYVLADAVYKNGNRHTLSMVRRSSAAYAADYEILQSRAAVVTSTIFYGESTLDFDCEKSEIDALIWSPTLGAFVYSNQLSAERRAVVGCQ